MMQAAAGAMVGRNDGLIVAMSSTAGLRGGTGRAAYGASKCGVIALASVMALELVPHHTEQIGQRRHCYGSG
jgi:NAD(P)-dependent dehydrogenase (short-subunit alcohol dehydrogenase family)